MKFMRAFLYLHSKKLLILIIFLTAVSSSFFANPITKKELDRVQIEFPKIIIRGVEKPIKISLEDESKLDEYDNKKVFIKINGSEKEVLFRKGVAEIPYLFESDETITIEFNGVKESKGVTPIPLWLSIIPPLIAILMALIFKEVYTSLFTGLLFGVSVIIYYSGENLVVSIFEGIISIPENYLLEVLTDWDHMAIILFTMMIGATVSLISHNGGMQGVVNKLAKRANTSLSGQFVTWLLGIMIFFDDYANTLIVGNTMKPVTDRLRISREKLAYLVDSTAAPIASIAFVTTWIGTELSYIQNGIEHLGLTEKPYNIFLSSLQYSFYPIFTLCFMLFLIFSKKDFGPMYKAETRARKTGEVSPKGFIKDKEIEEITRVEKPRWFNGMIPIIFIIGTVFVGLVTTGYDASVWADPDESLLEKISATIGNADPFKSLLWGSILGIIVSVLLTVSQRIMKLEKAINHLLSGTMSMLPAILILTMAWSIALITKQLQTAEFISRSLMEFSFSPAFLPVCVFFLSALVSFSTGSSWGTMAILYPLVLPTTWYLSQKYGFNHEQTMPIFLNVVSCVLSGSVLGDHCSPISDTTVLSSLASECAHIEHVRTQMPYALTAGGTAAFIGTLPASFGVPFYVTFPIGITLLFLVVRFYGKPVKVYKE